MGDCWHNGAVGTMGLLAQWVAVGTMGLLAQWGGCWHIGAVGTVGVGHGKES
jgi:hypothetical protein